MPIHLLTKCFSPQASRSRSLKVVVVVIVVDVVLVFSSYNMDAKNNFAFGPHKNTIFIDFVAPDICFITSAAKSISSFIWALRPKHMKNKQFDIYSWKSK